MVDRNKQPCLWKEICDCKCEDCEYYTAEDDVDDVIEKNRAEFRKEYNKYIEERNN